MHEDRGSPFWVRLAMQMRCQNEVQVDGEDKVAKWFASSGPLAASCFVGGIVLVGLPVGIFLSTHPVLARVAIAVGAVIGSVLMAGMFVYFVMATMRQERRRLQREAANNEAWRDHLRERRRLQEPASLDEIERLVESVHGKVRAELVRMLDLAINQEGRTITVEMIEELSRQAEKVRAGEQDAEHQRSANGPAPLLSAQGQFVRTLRARLDRSW